MRGRGFAHVLEVVNEREGAGAGFLPAQCPPGISLGVEHCVGRRRPGDIVKVALQLGERVAAHGGRRRTPERCSSRLPSPVGAGERVHELIGLCVAAAGQGQQVGEHERRGRDIFGEHASILGYGYDSVRRDWIGRDET